MATAEQISEWNDFVTEIVERWQKGSDRKQARSKRREKEIQEAALRVFARDGISRARIGDVAAEAGIPISTLYEYYSSKEELAYAVPIAHLVRFYAEYAKASKDKETAYDRLWLYLWLSADFARRNPQWARLFYLEIWPSVLVQDSELRHAIDDFNRISRYLILEGSESGEWPADPNPYETVSILTGSLNQLIITRLLYGKPRNLSKAASSLVSRTLQCLFQTEGRETRKAARTA